MHAYPTPNLVVRNSKPPVSRNSKPPVCRTPRIRCVFASVLHFCEMRHRSRNSNLKPKQNWLQFSFDNVYIECLISLEEGCFQTIAYLLHDPTSPGPAGSARRQEQRRKDCTTAPFVIRKKYKEKGQVKRKLGRHQNPLHG